MDVLAGALWAIGTVVALVALLGIAAFVALFRRRGDAAGAAVSNAQLATLTVRAGTLLVRLDDRVRDADDEVGYAIAQFGADRARPFAEAAREARGRLSEAFRLRQALDDAEPDSPRERREWTLQIIALCEKAEAVLDAQDAQFRALRADEAGAAGTLEDVRRRIADLTARLATARDRVTDLTERFAASAFAAVRDHPDSAARLISEATGEADAVAGEITATGVNAVSERLATATSQLREADRLLDAVDTAAESLGTAAAALADRRGRLAADAAEARAEIERAPDSESADAILQALQRIDALQPSDPADPVADLDRLEDAVADLDLALAGARNQTQRFAHARAAYEGTLLAARSQLGVARELVARGGVGVDARTRLAEAERQLELAAAETDPVVALDTVRRAVTHARDAEALARYDTMGRR